MNIISLAAMSLNVVQTSNHQQNISLTVEEIFDEPSTSQSTRKRKQSMDPRLVISQTAKSRKQSENLQPCTSRQATQRAVSYLKNGTRD
jgi:hypothetical protein